MKLYTVLCSLIICSVFRGALVYQERDVAVISKALESVSNWKGLAGWLNIRSIDIETNCGAEVNKAACYRKALVQSYWNKQGYEDPSKIAEGIAKALEKLDHNYQATQLRKLRFEREHSTLERERDKEAVVCEAENTLGEQPLQATAGSPPAPHTVSATEFGLAGRADGEYEGRGKENVLEPANPPQARSYRRRERPDMPHIILIKYKINNKQKEFRLVERILHKWQEIGILLGVPVNAIAGHKTIDEKCRDVLAAWLDKGSEQYPVEWDGLIKVLQDVQLKEVANDLREALDNITE